MQTIAIMGLGNIGAQYAMTRHNIGFLSLYAITQMINNPHILRDSITYDNTQGLLGDIETLVDKKQNNSVVHWHEQKPMQSLQAKISLKDFVGALEQYPFFLAQLKFLKAKRKCLDSESLQKIFREKLVSLPNTYEILCIAPTTFMNRSGIALSSIMKRYKISQLLVIHDDLDMRFGNLGLRYKGGSGGHNGLKSIHEFVDTKYLRIKFGVGSNILLDDMLYSLIDNETKVGIESFRTLFYETYIERLRMQNIFKTKSFFKVMENKMQNGNKNVAYESLMKLFYNHQKSGTKEVANYVLSSFNAHEKKLLSPLLAYNGLVVMAVIFEWAYRKNTQSIHKDSIISEAQIPILLDAFSISLK